MRSVATGRRRLESLSALGAVMLLGAFSPHAPAIENDAAGEGRDGADKRPYAKTPGRYTPFGRFVEPYKRFFLEEVGYYGPARDKPEPQSVKSVRIRIWIRRTDPGRVYPCSSSGRRF